MRVVLLGPVMLAVAIAAPTARPAPPPQAAVQPAPPPQAAAVQPAAPQPSDEQIERS